MRKLGGARRTDLPEHRPGLDPVAGLHPDAAAAQVTDLRFPAVAVVDHDAVAALDALDAVARFLRRPDQPVGHRVAKSLHGTGGGRDHGDAPRTSAMERTRMSSPVVPVIGGHAAERVAGAGPRIHVGPLLDEAVLPDRAGDGQPEPELGAGRRDAGPERRGGKGGDDRVACHEGSAPVRCPVARRRLQIGHRHGGNRCAGAIQGFEGFCQVLARSAKGRSPHERQRTPGRIMVAIDIATRVWNHTFKLDPIVRSLLDTDFYKLLMLQMVWGLHGDTDVTFASSTARRPCASRRARRGRTARPTRPRALGPLLQARDDLARRQHVLRRAPDLSARLPRWLKDFQLPPLRIVQARRPVRTHVLRALDRHDDVGDPALAIINELRSRAAMRPTAVSSSMCSTPAPRRRCGRRSSGSTSCGDPHLRLRHAPPPLVPVAALVRRGAEGKARPPLHRLVQRAPRDGGRSGSHRHQRARAADGRGRARRHRSRAA